MKSMTVDANDQERVRKQGIGKLKVSDIGKARASHCGSKRFSRRVSGRDVDSKSNFQFS